MTFQWMIVLGLLATVLSAVGCNQQKYVPVSGVVKLNGQPYPNAVVTFQPIGTSENPNPGRGSAANTDEQGRFVLVCDGTIDGALVGMHRVRIMSRPGESNFQPKAESRGGSSDETAAAAPAQAKFVEPIPQEWYAGEGKEFEVPPGGTDQANFDITTTR